MHPTQRPTQWILVLSLVSSCGGGHQESRNNEAQNTQSSSSPSPQPTSGAESSASPAPSSAAPASSETAANEPTQLPPMPTDLHGPSRPWAQMDAHERGRYMHDVVLPAMSSLFQAYDAHDFSHVTCATCHGDNAREVHFRMPNNLPSLPAFGTDAADRLRQRHPGMFEFMGQRVVPAMATLLGDHPFDPQTHQGFGCFNCHPHGT